MALPAAPAVARSQRALRSVLRPRWAHLAMEGRNPTPPGGHRELLLLGGPLGAGECGRLTRPRSPPIKAGNCEALDRIRGRAGRFVDSCLADKDTSALRDALMYGSRLACCGVHLAMLSATTR